MKIKNVPIIGISISSIETGINMSPAQQINMVSDTFLKIVDDYQCAPIMLPNQLHPEYADLIVENLSGLILTSGPDVHPECYGEQLQVSYSPNTDFIGNPYNRNIKLAPNCKRDELEIALYHAAKRKNIPIMGICRGMQIINVAEGGTLYQELENNHFNHFLEKSGWINYHEIVVDEATLCGKLLQKKNIFVSSIHHQGINKLGDKLSSVAKADDGIIEMIEYYNSNHFVVGFQSHVEMTRQTIPCFEKIFNYFFQEATNTIKNMRIYEPNC